MNREQIDQLKSICQNIGQPQLYYRLSQRLERLSNPFRRIAILGGTNTGKTKLINEIVSEDLNFSSSSVSSCGDIFIYPSHENYCIKNGKKVRFRAREQIDVVSEETTEVFTKSDWLTKNDLSISELHSVEIKDDSTDVEIADFFSRFDVCVYILNAMMPYTKEDSLVLSALNRFEIPTLLLVSQYQQLSDDDQNDVFTYISSKLAPYSSLTYFDKDSFRPFDEVALTVKNFVDANVSNGTSSNQRNSFKDLFISDAVAQCQDVCRLQIGDNELKKQRVSEITQGKKNKVKALQTEWMRLEVALDEKRQKNILKIKERLELREEEMLRRLHHDLDICHDVKQYWEKELPYRIDEMLINETQLLMQSVNADIANNLRWIQGEVTKLFGTQPSIIPDVTFFLDNQKVQMDDIQIADNKTFKIVTRIGTASVVVCAGVLAASAGIAGIVMATGVFSGIGAELLANRRTKESRKKVQSILPSILEKSRLEFVTKISESLKNSYAEIIKNLEVCHDNWESKKLKEIEEEEAIATHNLIDPKWQKCLEELEQLQLNEVATL